MTAPSCPAGISAIFPDMAFPSFSLPENPLFITGYPRSGTTLLQLFLTCQPGIYSFPETHYFCVVDKKLRFDPAGRIIAGTLPAALDKADEKTGLPLTVDERAMLERRAQHPGMTSKELFELIAVRLLAAHHPELNTRAPFHWLEKTPNHAHQLFRIREFYPAARFLHIMRHPVPAVLSRRENFPFNRDVPPAELARRWVRLQEDVENFRGYHPGAIMQLRYEDLTADVRGEMSRVLRFLEIPGPFLPPESSQFAEVSRRVTLPEETWKLNDQRRSIGGNTNSRYAGTEPDVIRQIEAVAGPLMARYGYPPYQEAYPAGGPELRT